MSEYILVSETNGIATITLNRPIKRNAMNADMVRELLQAIKKLSGEKEVRVLLINGNGENFCAGGDIDNMRKMAIASDDENYDDAQLLADLLYQLYCFPHPTIALVHGATMGGGMGLVCACDIALAANNAMFGFPEVKLGITPSMISPYVISAMGERAAHYYFLTGEKFTAEIALGLGLVHQVTDNETLLNSGQALAELILNNSPNALMTAKQLIRHISKEKITPALAQKTAEHLATLRTSEQAKEGLNAFLEKRKPTWS